MKYIVQPIREGDAREIATWQYDGPYAIYSLSGKDIPALLDPDMRYHVVREASGELVGYCCFGLDARVPGGEYDDGEPDVLDVGVGLHPVMTGKGLGKAFVGVILDYAARAFDPARFRVTIAEFNQRSQKVFLGLGFALTNRFERDGDGMRFVQLEREIC